MRDCHKRERQIRRGFMAFILLVSGVGCGSGLSDEGSSRGATAGASDAAVTRLETGITQPTEADSPTPFTPNPARPLVVPEAPAKELASPDIQVRLQVLDRWRHSAPIGAVDPLMVALEDEDERVQARALELLVQDWQQAQAIQPFGGQ